jgi:hypothetical protein
VLPFLLADIATTRGYGPGAGSAALTVLAIGNGAGSYAAGALGDPLPYGGRGRVQGGHDRDPAPGRLHPREACR